MQPEDVAAAPAPAPAPAPEPAPAPRKTRAVLSAVALVVAVVVLAVLLPPVVRRVGVWWQTGGLVPPVVYALAHIVPMEPCMAVNIDELANNTAVYGTVDLRNVRASLHHHLRHSGPGGAVLQGISAQYLERHRICHALINMINKPTDAENLVEMFNMRIIGVSTNRLKRNIERSVLCEHSYTARRFQDVVVEYWTPEGVRMERAVFGVAAQTIQQIDDVQSGNGYCQDTNLEAQIERVHRLLVETASQPAAAAFALPAPPHRN